MDECLDIAIIGGGPAGLSAAVTAAKKAKAKNQKIKIAIFEEKDDIGKSILATGNGRCNFSNYYAEKNNAKQYFNSRFVNKVFSSVNTKLADYGLFFDDEEAQTDSAVYQMFDYLSMSCHINEDGWMFPFTKKASTVVSVFKYELKDLNVKIYTGYKLNKFQKNNDNSFLLYFDDKTQIKSKKVILCAGGNKVFNDLGLLYKPEIKILGPIKTDVKYLKALDGIRVTAKATLKDSNQNILHQEEGEILFRKYGLSGIVIFNLSRFLYDANLYISIDFCPENTKEELYSLIMDMYEKKSENKDYIDAKRLLSGMMLPEIIDNICDYANIKDRKIQVYNVMELTEAIKDFQIKVKGLQDKKQCQVSRGGVSLECLDAGSLQCCKQKGLYCAGEILDVDGPCGGFNLHWAWSSGILAGFSAV